MTKPKRVILVLTDILMLLAGIFGVILFAALTYAIGLHVSVPTPDAIRAATGTSELRSMAEDSSEKFEAVLEIVQGMRWYFLGLGAFLAAGSIVHFCLTPWKLKDRPGKT